MDDTALNNRSLPLDWNGSVNPGQLNEVTMGTRLECTEGGIGGYPLFHRQSLDQMSPIRGRTMKEYDQQIVELKNENFNLKLRIFFLEERLQQKFSDSSDDLHKFNIDLKIEVENLKKELNDKQELLLKASTALESMEGTHKTEIEDMNAKFAAHKCDLDQQICVLKQKLSIVEKEHNSFNGANIDENKLDEVYYRQAFATLSSSESTRETRIDVDELENKISNLSDELSSSQTRIVELEKCLAEKDAFIKEEEITKIKTHKLIQGILNTVTDKEKQLKQLQEQYDSQSTELKNTKEQLSLATEVSVPVCIARVSEARQNKQTADTTNECKEKDKIIQQLEAISNQRQDVINGCLKLLGVGESEICNFSCNALINVFKSKIMEQEEKTQFLLEEKSKLLKDKENELMRYQERLEEKENLELHLKGQLKKTFISVEELKMALHKREEEIEKLSSTIQRMSQSEISSKGLDNRNEAIVEIQKENNKVLRQYQIKEDIIGHLKDYLELLLDESSQKILIEQKSASLRQILARSVANDSEARYYDEKLSELEYIIRTNIAKNKLLENQLTAVRERMSVLRKLVDRIQNGGASEDKSECDNCLDLEENMQVVLRGIKVMSNLNNLFCHHIKLNNELSYSKTESALNSQMSIDVPVNLNKLKCAQCASLIANELPDKLPNILEKTVSSTSGCNGETLLNAMILLRSDYLKIIDGLKQKVVSTENTVRTLSSKVKYYRKVMHETSQEKFQSQKENMEGAAASTSCRSMSVDDLLLSQKESILYAEDNQALSADNVLDSHSFNNKEEKAPILISIRGNIGVGKLDSPYTPDSLFEYGQTSDVLELKEQVCRLKLLLEQKECHLNELYSEREMGRSMSLMMNPCLSHLHSFLKEQTLSPSEKNSFTDLMSDVEAQKSWIKKSDMYCQVGDGDIRNFADITNQNIENELQWLRNINIMTQTQLEVLISEIPNGNYSSFIQLQQQDISMLRHRLLESHDACELLRIRLEELAEFLEHLLRFDENGLLDISQFTPQSLELLKRRIAESRELTHSISHSLLVDPDLSNITSITHHSDSIIGHHTLQNIERNNCSDIMEKLKGMVQICPANERISSLSSVSNSIDIDYTRPESEEPSKLVQSSCDDLILLLKPEHDNSQPNTLDIRFTPDELSNSATQNDNNNEIRALDAFKEQAIMAEYGRHYTSRQYCDSSDRRFTYHRTAHTLSHNIDPVSDRTRLEYHMTGDLSPSDSESWSEPDRDVSQQRIGLELEKPDLSLKPKMNISSSNVQSTSEESNSMKNSTLPSSRRFRNEGLQIENLQRRLQNEIEVNKCLKSELKLANALEKDDSDNYKVDKHVLKTKTKEVINCNDRRRHSNGSKVKSILNEHLLEVRSLRLRLEESIHVNDILREKLEKRLRTRHIHRNEDEIDRLALELEEKEQMLNELDQQIRYHLSLCNKQKGFEMETEELHHQLTDLTDKLQLSSVQIQQLERELVTREEGSQQLKEANHRLQNSISHMQTALVDKEGVVKELREANTRMQRTLESMDKLHKQQTLELEKVNKLKEQAEIENKDQMELCKKEMNEMKKREGELNDELKSSREKAQQFSIQFDELKVAIAHMEEELEREHGSRLSTQQKLNETENYLVLFKEKASSFENALHTLEEELNVEKKKSGTLQEVLVEKEKMITHFKDIVSKLQQTNAEKTALIHKEIEAIGDFEKKMNNLRDTSARKESELSCRVVGLESKLIELQKMVKEKTQSLEKQENGYEQLQVMLDERSTAIRKLEDELKTVMEENEKLQHQSFYTTASLKETRDLNSSLKTELTLYEQFHSKGCFKTIQSPNSRRVLQGLSHDIGTDTLLSEMRRLRTQLELSIQTNNALREQLKENYAVKSGGNNGNEMTDNDESSTLTVTSTKNQNQRSWYDFSSSHSQSNAPMKKCASYPPGRSDFMSTQISIIRQQSKSLSDYVFEDPAPNTFREKSDIKNVEKLKLKIETPAEHSISDQQDSHSVYSSPDLGIESDPSHFSSLEKRLTNITEEHLREIRSVHQCDKNLKRTSTNKLQKHNAKLSSGNQLVYAIGSVNDYDLLKKDLENNLTTLKGLQSRVKERLQSSTRTSVKNSEYMTLKEIEKKMNSLIIGLGKSLKLVSCFWKSMLNSPPVIEAKNPKLLEENLLLKKKLEQQKINLQDALTKLAASSRLKEGMEKAIMKQLTKTHDVLKRAKGNLEDQANNPKTKSTLEKV